MSPRDTQDRHLIVAPRQLTLLHDNSAAPIMVPSRHWTLIQIAAASHPQRRATILCNNQGLNCARTRFIFAPQMPSVITNPGRAIKRTIMTLLYEASIATGVLDETIFSVYSYMFSPSQLIFFTRCLAETKCVPGCCIEVGCANGRTTAFLRKFMEEHGITKAYYAIDTFSGFVPEHATYEIERRKKSRVIEGMFAFNKKRWFDHALALSGVTSVTSVETDATKFDYDRIGPIAFALLDLDLYPPMIDVLPKLYCNLSPGGVMLVDDCAGDELWDGSLVAYEEFIRQAGLAREIVLGKIGVIRKANDGTAPT
jgi:O-methyltransferase